MNGIRTIKLAIINWIRITIALRPCLIDSKKSMPGSSGSSIVLDTLIVREEYATRLLRLLIWPSSISISVLILFNSCSICNISDIVTALSRIWRKRASVALAFSIRIFKSNSWSVISLLLIFLFLSSPRFSIDWTTLENWSCGTRTVIYPYSNL